MIDGLAMLERGMLATTNVVGGCLFEWWRFAGSPHNGHTYGTAMAAFRQTSSARTLVAGDRNPPRGAVCWLAESPTRTDKNKNAGDVCASLGGGLLRVTDGAGNGRMGIMSIAAREAQTQRPYLGWSREFWDQPVSFDTSSTEETNVAITDADAQKIALAICAVQVVNPANGTKTMLSDMWRYAEQSDIERREELLKQLPAAIWQLQVPHPIAKDADGKPAMISIGEYVRLQPLANSQIQGSVEKVATGGVDQNEVANKFVAALGAALSK